MAHTYKRIIVARTDKIGDLILSIPSFFMLRKMYPDAEITLLVRNYNYNIVKNLPYINRVVQIDNYRQKELLEKIKYFNADVFIALYVDNFVMELAKASKAKIKIGPLSKLKSFFTFNKGILQKRSKSIKHEAEYNLDLIKKLDKKIFEERFEINTQIFLDKNNIEAAEKFFKDNNIGKKVLVVNPFMGGSAKNITDSQYADIIRRVIDYDKDIEVIITAHISDEDRGINLLKKIDREKVYLFANGGELLNIGAVINKAKVYFGGSTGPTHIAGSLQKSIVALYPKKPSQSPVRWGIFGNDDVTYIIPDENSKENYKHKEFDSYTKEIENTLVQEIIKRLER
ncbi:glycosyltransferase family 9 protein [Cetobacterium somerae]|uniref:glycosyltransferase family 9 protein n=1 Tax=Cetobacterium sp. NK01 TaxID=2993530 RepID=UPI00211652A7|nr:glycosyltransferase family 9 protein [Cetobacterium sp. NK01]MCQ8212402.1 glycosyltransferase family 9 protein [Cetobacterium sp. NK01]